MDHMDLKLASILLHILTGYLNLSIALDNFKVEYEWSQIEFDFANEEERQEAINNGTFKEGMVQPIDVQVYYADYSKQTVFISCPRVSEGIPATFGIVTDKRREGNPIITPYPSWEWHQSPRLCKKRRIISVYRVFIDDCHRLWILDNGKFLYDPICTPQILVFDLRMNVLLHQYEIPFEQHLNTSLYVTPVVEVDSKNCRDAFVYNADPTTRSLLVYDFKNDRSWRITNKTTPSFNPDPNFAEFNIDGLTFNVKDGILALSLSPPGRKRKLFYHAMAGVTENWVYTAYLKNESLLRSGIDVGTLFHTYRERRNTQSAIEAMDKSGNLYFGLLTDIKIAAWSTKQPKYEGFRIIGDNKKTMQFPSGMKVIVDPNGEEILWVFATAFQRIDSGNIFPNQTNFFLLSVKVKDVENLNKLKYN